MKSEKFQRAIGSVYHIKTSMNWERSYSAIQNVLEFFRVDKVIMLQNKFARSIQQYRVSEKKLCNE